MPLGVRRLLALVVMPCTLWTTAARAATDQAPAGRDAYVRAHRAVSTSNAEAQAAFDDGLTLLYAFNPQQARHSFERALGADPDLALASWGIAMSYGTNINTSYDAAAQRAGHDAIVRAESHAAHASAVEHALIAAAAQRFARYGKNDADADARAYRDAMAQVAQVYPGDDDVVAFSAEAAMDTRPWGYWTGDGKPEPGTLEMIHALQAVLARDAAHIGANHYLIHVTEASPHPEIALEAARRLAADTFEPAAEHLAHMPAHTLMRAGDYDAAAQANVHALDAFHAYVSAPHAAGHEDYLGHDCLFAVDAFMMAGERQNALRAAARCGDAARRYEGYVAVRFRRWDDLAPAAAESPFLHALWASSSGRTAEAGRLAQQLEAAKDDNATIAAAVVKARLAAQAGERDREIALLEHAVQVQDHQGYAEPPAWFYPVRESLGAAQYRAGRYGQAERTFRADLARNPQNPRSLFGLAAALQREGRVAEARSTRASFEGAWRHADVSLDMTDL